MTDLRRPGADALDPKMMVPAVYSLCLAGLVSFGATAVIGAVLVLATWGSAPVWARSHFDFQLRSLAALFAGAALAALLTQVSGVFGILLLAALAIWFGVRMIRGLKTAVRGESHPSPRTWLA